MSKRRELLQVIRASYRLRGSNKEWLSRLAAHLAKVASARNGSVAFRFRVASQGFQAWDLTPTWPCTYEYANMLIDPGTRLYSAFNSQLQSRAARCGSLSETGFLDPPEVAGHSSELFEDALNFLVLEPDGEGCAFFFPAGKIRKIHQRTRQSWQRMLVHIDAGFRLRRLRAAEILDAAASVLGDHEFEALEAIFAQGTWSVRDILRRVAVSLDQALARRGPAGKALAQEVYQGLFTGSWKLLDHFDEGDRRFVIARRVEPDGAAPLRLTPSELEVVRCAMEWSGDNHEGIAQRMGMSPTHVSNHLSRALDKLGVHNRTELIAALRGARSVDFHRLIRQTPADLE